MLKKERLILFIAGAMTIVGCKKDEASDVKPQEKGKATIHAELVTHKVGKPLGDVELQLANVDDNLAVKNVFKATTDYTGKAFFKDLDKGNYIFSGITPEYELLETNHFRNVLFTISEGESTQKTIQFSAKECTFYLKNNSSNPYTIYINEAYKGVLQGKERASVDVSKGIVRVVQRSGYVLYPTEENYVKNINCAEEEVTISFP